MQNKYDAVVVYKEEPVTESHFTKRDQCHYRAKTTGKVEQPSSAWRVKKDLRNRYLPKCDLRPA